MRGTLQLDVAARDLEATRADLARAVASGGLGGVGRLGREVAIELVDGHVEWSVSLARLEALRAAESVLVATGVAVACTVGFALAFHVALPVGAVVGGAWAALRLVRDRARVRRAVQALLASLAC